MNRRTFCSLPAALAAQPIPTQFQIGCMTLPYAPFPLERALEGIAASGCKYVGWGTSHQRVPVIAPDASAATAKALAARCRNLGIEPVMMFATVNIEDAESIRIHTLRIEQAAAAGIPYIITFGRTIPGSYDIWVRNLKHLGPIARANNVVLTVKQHGGNSATGVAISKLLAGVSDAGVSMCYDAGNVLDYENQDPLADIQQCWRDVRSFAIKDHRNFPKDQDCGPGFGEIDHYKLLSPVAKTGRAMPLICENIFEPLVPRTADASGVDRLAARAREYLESVVRGLLAVMLLIGMVKAADADLILHNGKVLTVDSRFSVAQAVALKDSRISAVGQDAAVMREKGSGTRVIDLEGKTVLPGLFDSHVHPLEAGLSEFRAALPKLDSFSAVQDYIRVQAAKAPKGQWIVVPRTFPTRLKEMRMPTREVLDVAPDHPVMFDASYVVVANSYALKVNGITRDTPDPPGGVIVKDERGEPNGILRNAQRLLKNVRQAAAFSEAEKLQALEAMLRRYAAAGLTTVVDRSAEPADVELYRKLKAQNRLPVRVGLTWWLDISRPQADLVREVESAPYKTNDGDHWLRYSSFKVNIDGGMTIGTAYQRRPYGPFGRQLYGQTDPTNKGQLFATPEKFLAVFRAARDKGWALSAHDQGGGAIDVFLDAMEALNREKPLAPTRSHLIHASFQSTEAIARARRLGVLADVQAPWLLFDGPALEKVMGSGGMNMFFPLRSYLDAGVRIAAGSDHMIGFDKNRAVNPYNPFLNIWTTVTRKMSDGRVLNAAQRISRQEALKAHTINGAYFQFEERHRGSIEPGKLADLVVVDRDFLTCPEDDLRNIQPLMTIIEGRIAYQNGKSQ